MAGTCPEDEREYRAGCAAHGGSARAWFEAEVRTIVARMLHQDGGPAVSPGVIEAGICGLWEAAEAIGWPPPLSAGVTRRAGETPGAALEPRAVAAVAGVEGEAERTRLLPVIRQLLKACVYPEFTECRDSYRAAGVDGRCSRQQPTVAAARISGSPCVDCPYFVTLPQPDHEALLRAGWIGAAAGALRPDSSVFLPKDFRALRRFLWLRSRFGSA